MKLFSFHPSGNPQSAQNPLVVYELKRMRRTGRYRLGRALWALLLAAFLLFPLWRPLLFQRMFGYPIGSPGYLAQGKFLPAKQTIYSYDKAAATTTCLISYLPLSTMTIRLRDISTSETPAMLGTYRDEDNYVLPSFISFYLEKCPQERNVKSLSSGSAKAGWRLRGGSISRWKPCEWTFADLALPRARRDEIHALIQRETKATIKAESVQLPLPDAMYRTASFNMMWAPPNRLFEASDPFNLGEWITLEARLGCRPPVCYPDWTFGALYRMGLPDILMGKKAGMFLSPSSYMDHLTPSLQLSISLGLLRGAALAGFVLFCLLMPFAYAAEIQKRINAPQFDQIRVTCLGEEEIYEGLFAGAWLRLRQTMLLIVICLLAATVLTAAMAGIHAYVAWRNHLDYAFTRESAVPIIIFACVCIGAPLVSAVSLCACATWGRNWMRRLFIGIAIPAIFISAGVITSLAIILALRSIGILRGLSEDSLGALGDWGWAGGAASTLALIVWIFIRTLRWTRRNFVRRVIER
ncbi:MAG: hypothetical protein NTX50_31860 [Candidatus Sumerlaeota bacterium]|nr:hypothetical protein [Candidatus Sumerlaeota bacterium]